MGHRSKSKTYNNKTFGRKHWKKILITWDYTVLRYDTKSMVHQKHDELEYIKI